MAETNFTQEQVNEQITNAKAEWVKQELNPIVTERDDLLQYKPKDKTDDEKAFEQKQQELWQKEVGLSLKENGLEKFASVVKVSNEDELKEVVKSLSQVVNDIKVSTGYIPQDHAQMTEYDQAKQSGDSKSMIKSLFGLK